MMCFGVTITSLLVLSLCRMPMASTTMRSSPLKVQSLRKNVTDVPQSKLAVPENELAATTATKDELAVMTVMKELTTQTSETQSVSFLDELLEETCSVSCEVLLLTAIVLMCSARMKSKRSVVVKATVKQLTENATPDAESVALFRDEKLQRAMAALDKDQAQEAFELATSFFQTCESEPAGRRLAMDWLRVLISSMRQRDATDAEIASAVLNVFKRGALTMNQSSTTSCIFLLHDCQEHTVLALVFCAFSELQATPSSKAISVAVRALPKVSDLSLLQTLNRLLGQEAKDEQFYFHAVQCCLSSENRAMAEQYIHEANSLQLCSARMLQPVLVFMKDKRYQDSLQLVRSISTGKHFSAQVKFNMEVQLLCKQGAVEEASALISSAPEQVDETARNQFLRLLALKDLQKDAEDEVAAIRSSGLQINAAGYASLIEMHFRLHDAKKAFETFKDAKSNDKANHTLYAQMLRNLTYVGAFFEALSIFDEMNDAGFADISLSALLASKLLAAERYENARSVLQDSRPRQANCANGSSGANRCSVENFMTLIHCAGKLDLLDVALATFELCIECHGKADILLYNKMMDVCITCKQPQQAVEFFEAIKRQIGTPDVIGCNTVIRAYAQLGDVERAFRLIEQMQSQGIKPNAVTFNSLAGAAIKAHEVERAWCILPLMAAAGVQPDSVTYSTLIMGIKQSKSIEMLNRGFECLQQLKENGLKPDEVLFNSLMDACVHLKQMSKAQAVLKTMKDAAVKPSFVTYSILIKGYGLQHNLKAALQVKEDMDAEGVTPNAVLYGSLADVALKSADYEQADQILQEMDDKGIASTVVTHSLKIKVCGRRRQLQKALDLFDEMEPKGIPPSAFTFNSLLDTVARCRQMQHVPRLLQLMKKYALKPDLITFSTIIKGYCQADDLPQAMATFQILKNQGLKPDEILYNSLLDGCARVGDTKQAGALLVEMQNARIAPSEVTFSILAKAHANANEVDEVFDILKQMRHARVKPGMVIYTCIIQACASSGQLTRAIQVFEEMTHKGIYADGATFGVLIAGYVRNSEWRPAIDLVKRAMDCNARLHSKTYRLLSTGLSRAQQHLMIRELEELQKQWPADDRAHGYENMHRGRW